MEVGQVIYRGVRAQGKPLVFREVVGGQVLPLHHVVRHSPGGFEWGYGGSGPADLARSMLIDALGTEAYCPGCGGPRADGSAPANCECGDGYAALPYQDFKWDMVADLPDAAWTLRVEDVRLWAARHWRRQDGDPT